MDIPKITVLAAFCIIACGCATSKTVGVSAGAALIPNYLNSRTACSSLPRIYSGLAYNYCFAINAERRDPVMYNSVEQSVYLLDSVSSAILDTVVLPYTIYSQANKGNIRFSD